ncbi:MAG: hypothetical protein WD851_16765 [Pirellulales bacterium]
MVYQGIIQNGMLLLDDGVQLPEGAPVRVELLTQPTENKKTKIDKSQLDPVFRMGELAVDTGIPDLAVNINHYLYGHPKVKDVP